MNMTVCFNFNFY